MRIRPPTLGGGTILKLTRNILQRARNCLVSVRPEAPEELLGTLLRQDLKALAGAEHRQHIAEDVHERLIEADRPHRLRVGSISRRGRRRGTLARHKAAKHGVPQPNNALEMLSSTLMD
jgi:hypothetical protein